MMPASRRRSSISRVLAANAFIAKMWRGEAAVTRKPDGRTRGACPDRPCLRYKRLPAR